VSSLSTERRDLRGQCAIVTGAGRGIGKAIAIGFAAAGAHVCCVARTPEEIEATAREIAAGGGEAFASVADVVAIDAVQAMTQKAVERLGGLDILVINAGIDSGGKSVEESLPERWRATIETNLLGAYHCAAAAIPHLKRRGGGKIITIGSGIGHRGRPERSDYACSKAGLWMLTRVLAQELADFNISVNELVPGPVVTPLSREQASEGSGVFGIRGEWIKGPEAVVPLALFLATQPLIGPTAQSFSLMRRDN
jgi:3-oxoacyl-[acyl-carrier protein] reductase